MKKDKFDSFFKLHSENVDNANSQGFWKLSDEIVKSFLLEVIDNRKGGDYCGFWWRNRKMG